jgi:hypothetical protein
MKKKILLSIKISFIKYNKLVTIFINLNLFNIKLWINMNILLKSNTIPTPTVPMNNKVNYII